MPRWQALIAGASRWLLSEGGVRLRRTARRPPSTTLGTGLIRPLLGATWWSADPCWYPGGTPPRRHNHVTPLVDGERYFAALLEALTGSRSYIYIAGWCLSPDIPLDRSSPQAIIESRLVKILPGLAQRVPVRILLWSGAPLLYEPNHQYTRRVQARFARAARGDLECRLDTSARFSHTHHQKAVVVDGQVAFVGGMDLTTFSGDRWDTPAHPLRAGLNWHDVQLRVEGEAVADVEANFRQRWTAVTGAADLPHRPPAVDPRWHTAAQVVRTIPRGIYSFAPRGEFGIYHAYLTAIARARRLIYLENQYLWSPEIMDALTAALRRPRAEPFRVVLVLPDHAGDGRWDNNKHVVALHAAAKHGPGQAAIYTLYTSGPFAGPRSFTYRPIYIHAKVGIIDDEWLMIGSANLNTRGLQTDGEMNVLVQDTEVARNLRIDLWAEHLAIPRDQIAAADPVTLVDQIWRTQAETNARIRRAGHRPQISAVQRYVPGARPTDWVLEDVQSLTFEH
jgi:phosphatidylserine/phosphatidylglycerophosphate/cardiolipin synthase-like enzyme